MPQGWQRPTEISLSVLPVGERPLGKTVAPPIRMNAQLSLFVLPGATAFLVCAAFAWLAARLHAVSHTQSGALRRMLALAALAIGGFGVWWPGHFLQAERALGPLFPGVSLVAAALAFVLAGFAGVTARALTQRNLPAVAALGLAAFSVAYAHSMLATPGLISASSTFGMLGSAAAVALLAATLVGLAMASRPSHRLRLARACGAAFTAALLTGATLATAVAGDAQPAPGYAWAEPASWAFSAPQPWRCCA